MNKAFSNNSKIQQLLQISSELTALGGINELLGWDQEVLMPKKGAENRGNQQALISKIAHETLIDSKNADLIKSLNDEIVKKPDEFTLYDKALVREFDRAYQKATKLPTKFVTELASHNAKSVESWKEARAKSDFSIFEQDLQKMVELKIQAAEYYGYKDSPYDALLDEYEPNLTQKQVEEIFEPLKKFTIEFLAKLQKSDVNIDSSILARDYPIDKQTQFNLELAKQIGYDFDAGRLDLSAHPFTVWFGSSKDVRITTRYFTDQLQASIMATIHEAGHGMYEQGISDELDGTFLGTGTSLGIHESQSRMWENSVGRSPEFWEFWFPKLVQTFPDKLNNDEKDNFVRALNKVEPSFIRVEADEVTYNLHIIIRFEIEKALISGELKVADLPAAWNEKYTKYLGITPQNDAQGVLQDIHWSIGSLGYFPTYSLGNIYAAQFWTAIMREIPSVNQDIAQGDCSSLLNWLREKIHKHGMTYSAAELCKQITNEDLNSEYLQTYLTDKFSRLYEL